MKLDDKLRTLGPVNHTALKAAVAVASPDVWRLDQVRQNIANVHSDTQSIVLFRADGWPQVSVTRRPGWQYLSPQALPLMKQIVEKHYPIKGTVIRALVAKLVAGGAIGEHFDDHPTFEISHRIHVPLITNDQVDFIIGGETFHLAEGIAYEVSNRDYHAVNNRGAEDRMHFIFDYLPDASAS